MMTSYSKAALPVFAILTSFHLAKAADAETCVSLTSKAEAASDKSNWKEAKEQAQKAIDACKKEKQKTARPYMVMAVAANAEKNSEAVIKWSKEGLAQEPASSGLAHMNICSAYYELKKYDDAIKACQEGLKAKPTDDWKGKLNFNLGLATFNKFSQIPDPKALLKSEPYFRETVKLIPKFGGGYHYLGVLEAAAKGNTTEAIKYMKQACERGYEQGCEWAKKLASAPAPNAQGLNSANGKAVPTAPDDAALFERLKQAYLKKGMPEASVDQMIAQLKTSFAKIPAPQRKATLSQMIQEASK